MTFENIKGRAEAHWQEALPGSATQISDVVITVPAFFSQAQRNAVIDSAAIAGLNVVALIDDGLAVAVNFAQNREFTEEKQYHMIYDMGAGSTKATLVSFATINGTLQLEVEGYGYDDTLGGHLFTESIKNILETKFLSMHPHVQKSEFLANAKSMNRLWQAADKAKLVLSANTETRIS
ncbi:unnamed protein product, partial [Ambrosiozyma monospora]